MGPHSGGSAAEPVGSVAVKVAVPVGRLSSLVAGQVGADSEVADAPESPGRSTSFSTSGVQIGTPKGNKGGRGKQGTRRSTAALRIFTLNVRKLKQPAKFEACKQPLFDVQAATGAIAETHMSNENMGGLVLPEFKVELRDGRPNSAYGAGVRIVVAAVVAVYLAP